ncbi:glycine zipper 2TM domain-containing protein [Phenylobacterium aquaticum]|uniref:glycine zipper 2TM domain-containing protein n=1 Tax=Phenylobacterium aquaticum TaxID=1763816 RepID=UPI0026F19D51|nr:glycine zipper 2TM domain-containing protein [Phenylobacterium aquaticum]
MRAKSFTAALLILATAATALPAEARTHHRHVTHRVWVCENPRHAGNTGTIVGAIGGALVGNAVSSGGGKTGGTLIGAGVGGLAGHQIAKQHAKRNCHYEYR